MGNRVNWIVSNRNDEGDGGTMTAASLNSSRVRRMREERERI